MHPRFSPGLSLAFIVSGSAQTDQTGPDATAEALSIPRLEPPSVSETHPKIDLSNTPTPHALLGVRGELVGEKATPGGVTQRRRWRDSPSVHLAFNLNRG